MHWGSTRNGDFSTISMASPSAYLDLDFFIRTFTVSPGIAPETKTVFPSAVLPTETPFAPAERSFMFSKIRFFFFFKAQNLNACDGTSEAVFFTCARVRRLCCVLPAEDLLVLLREPSEVEPKEL